jgi:hypothetical protein
MRDPLAPDSQERKKIMFYDSPDRQARLRIRCQYDGISQSQFFRMMMTGYLENNSKIIGYLDECKERYNTQGVTKRRMIKAGHKKAREASKKFALDREEIEGIYDVLENHEGD